MALWTPPPIWESQDAFLIGGGASLAAFDFSVLRHKNTIACNDAFRLGPEIVKFCLFGDATWFHCHKWEAEKSHKVIQFVTCAPSLEGIKLHWLHQVKRIRDGLHSGDTIGWNYSTGAAAVNLAVSLGATAIYLLGYDMGLNDKGKSHWHNYAVTGKRANPSCYPRFVRGFQTLAIGLQKHPHVKVWNVTDGSSKLPVFDRLSFDDFLARFRPPAALSLTPLLSGSKGALPAGQEYDRAAGATTNCITV